MIYSIGKRKAVVAKSAFIAPGSHVIGSVNLAENSSVWFNVVIRGDCDEITVGPDTNIQDGSVLHTDYDIPLILGKGVTVGHKVMLHGCEIGDYSLIGINAVVLNGAKIGRYCLIGANSLVTENMEIPDGSLVMGSPAKIIKTLNEQQQAMLKGSAEHYVNNAKRYMSELIEE
ncbi:MULTISPECIES: gamma carbonic anhydrase family protein [Alteromonadaceae]|uniref:gamma carbonic anhydrase family protein n=1 Tax=Alteromonadaceae TaxID=72275 RepID=UPI001C07F3A9|nr:MULTISPECIES: gamma carbonic anhydrase family protein [unclassified Aliiglaciecola]MBU2876288.1 gamma carbonic anhydrase family protein [Aliiglaciecola lipolytica]MDO6710504.1 gamma carbonic anhydrase family protein [Aliiglaciecola sp. 2_MG-2023]MDO6751631.1 gamma carbonic anhydrase family protein [Aliiglaciecola sp. 1_MG-2023]